MAYATSRVSIFCAQHLESYFLSIISQSKQIKFSFHSTAQLLSSNLKPLTMVKIFSVIFFVISTISSSFGSLTSDQQGESEDFPHPILKKKSFSAPSRTQNDSLPTYVTESIENDVAAQIYSLIDHFKQDDPVGVPFPVPDPMEIPKTEQKVLGATLKLDPVFLHGISRFRIERAAVELDKVLQGSCRLSIEEVMVDGNYSLKYLLGRSNGEDLNFNGFFKI